MPEHLRALVVILILATTVFLIAKVPACAQASNPADFDRRRNLWFAITLIAFLAHSFWLFIAIAAIVLCFSYSRESNKLALFFALLFTVPAFSADITGLGVINSFFSIHYVRLLILVILLPAYVQLRQQPEVDSFGKLLPDKFVAGYIVLNICLMFPLMSLTATLREGVFYAFVDIFLPYYVASRYLKSIAQFRDALMAFAVAVLILAVIGIFEFARHWLLYSTLDNVLGVSWGYGNYLGRGTVLRAQASTGHSIVLGYVVLVGMSFFVFLKKSVPQSLLWRLGMLAFACGIVVPVARGPWLGAIVVLFTLIAVGSSPGKGFLRLTLLAVLGLPALFFIPGGQAVIDHLPFVGKFDDGSVNYRQRLLEVSIDVVLMNPLFGNHNFWSLPVMQQLRQGEGIIDLVNTFLGIALVNGLVGLFLFSGAFVSAGLGLMKALWKHADKTHESYLLGQVLVAAIAGIMATIFTVSSITVVPVVYWSVIGVAIACRKLIQLPAMSDAVTPPPQNAAVPRRGYMNA